MLYQIATLIHFYKITMERTIGEEALMSTVLTEWVIFFSFFDSGKEGLELALMLVYCCSWVTELQIMHMKLSLRVYRRREGVYSGSSR